MYVQSLNLASFRNYERLDLEPSSGTNVLFGSNAQGKSAVLEAVYLLATSKSHRTSRDTDLIRIGDDQSRVYADVIRTAQNDVSLEMVLSRSEKKSVKVNKVRHPKIGDLVGQLNAVIFSSSDIDMVKGEPSLRRRFLNLEISQTSPQYVYALGRYKRVLDQRNNLLKEMKLSGGRSGGLDVWDNQLAEYGAAVIARRMKFSGFLATAAAKIYSSLSDGSEELVVTYKPNLDASQCANESEVAARFAETLAAKRDIDMSRGTTTTGPHRDDLILTVDGLAAREYASQGQQRSVALALKLAEIDVLEESAGESPVVLLDDVTAELDEKRRARVFELTMGRSQTIVTTTHLTELDQLVVGSSAVFEVVSGTVTAK